MKKSKRINGVLAVTAGFMILAASCSPLLLLTIIMQALKLPA
jgi:hypothetical protein